MTPKYSVLTLYTVLHVVYSLVLNKQNKEVKDGYVK